MEVSQQFTLRRNNYSLDEQQQAVQETFGEFFAAVSTSAVVRAAEPQGYDQSVWRKALETGVVSMAVSEARGGDGATVVDLALVAEEYGRNLAPIPLIESVSAARLLSLVEGDTAAELLAQLLAGSSIGTLALHAIDTSGTQLIPAGAIAAFALALDGDDLVVVRPAPGISTEPNLGALPLAWWDIGTSEREIIASGPSVVAAFKQSVRMWKLLTGAALSASADASVQMGVDFAKSRQAFGQSIGTFQAISHSLVDAATLATASRNLVRKAAWYEEYEPDQEPALVSMAFLSASGAAVKATTVGVHVQGGFGFTSESDMTLHFRRAKGWALLAQRSSEELLDIAETLPLPQVI